MPDAKIAFNNRMWKPQDLSFNPHVAHAAMLETAWTSLAYGFGASSRLHVYAADHDTLIDLDRLLDDAISLSMGIFTIQVPHDGTCNRFICNCKIH